MERALAMNFKTTLALIILVGAGATVWLLGPDFVPWLRPTQQAPAPADAVTLTTLKNELAADKLARLEVPHAGGQLILVRPSGGAWSLPGGWPARQQEVEELVRLVTGLASSRFSPLARENPPELKKYGLDQPPVRMIVWVGSQQYRLAFGEEQLESNRFSRATYLRLEDKPEVIRLAPGLVTILERPQDYYQQRRLFPSERVARDADSQEKADRLEARSIAVKGATGSYALTKKDDEWELSEPVHDHVDPDKLKTLLASVPDIWAEQFVNKPNKDLAEYGLKEPEQTLRVAGKANSEVTLLIGKKARTKTRTVMRPAPSFGGPPMPPQQEVVHEEYRYAKLAGKDDQIFEIKADKLKDIFVDGKSLRDAQLARFRTDEARRVEINPGNGLSIVLAKDKDHWQLQKPYQGDAEDSKVTELLDKLSGLQTRDKDVLDGADTKTYGLSGTPASVKVTAEEKPRGEAKASPRKTRTFTFTLGKHDVEKKNVYVRMEGYSRINAVEDSVLL